MGKKHCILLIDDDFDLRNTISELLNNEGFEAILAENGSQGIQKAIEHRPDAIVCDIVMPGINGYEVFNMLKQISTTSVIPFIFISEKSSKEDILTGLQLGVDDYIPKPFDVKSFLKVIKNRIESRKKVIELNDEKFHALINTSLNGALILNGQLIEYTNKRFADMLGYAKDELIGNNLINFIHKDDITNIVDSITKCQIGAIKDFEVEFKAIAKDNGINDLILSGSGVDFNGDKKIVSNCIPISNQLGSTKISKNTLPVKLTNREIEILALVCQGLTNSQIAAKLFLSERTIEGYRTKLFDKTETTSAVSLAMWAVKNKIINV